MDNFLKTMKNEIKAICGFFDEKSEEEKNKSSTPEWDKVVKLANLALNDMISDKPEDHKDKK